MNLEGLRIFKFKMNTPDMDFEGKPEPYRQQATAGRKVPNLKGLRDMIKRNQGVPHSNSTLY
jgi:hypothetical protein